jgi:hypothetical protein
MKSREAAKLLFDWLRTHSPASIAQIRAAGLFQPRDAHFAIQFGLRYEIFGVEKRSAARQADRAAYFLTGKPFPGDKDRPAEPSFDGLLSAWGIALVPPKQSSVPGRIFLIDPDV